MGTPPVGPAAGSYAAPRCVELSMRSARASVVIVASSASRGTRRSAARFSATKTMAERETTQANCAHEESAAHEA